MDRTVSFLEKRDGIDKVLKVIRYTSKLLIAQGTFEGEAHFKLKAIDSSLGASRKAMRIGKFLSNVRAASRCSARASDVLPFLAATGEGTYYFLDQISWLIKIGVVSKTLEPRITRASNIAELVCYAATLTTNTHILLQTMRQIRMFELDVMRCSAECSMSSITESQTPAGDDDMVVHARKKLKLSRARQRLVLVLIAKDLADALIAMQDLAGPRAKLASPTTVALCGVLSAFASIWKSWPR